MELRQQPTQPEMFHIQRVGLLSRHSSAITSPASESPHRPGRLRQILPWTGLCLLFCVSLASPGLAQVTAELPDSSNRQLILAHYMPWYAAPPQSPTWGWHWTMNHFDPEKIGDGKRSIASHHYPLIGPYDSSDPWVLRCQLLQMKLAGIDGVIVDWYGLADFRDYPRLHQNTLLLAKEVAAVGMKLAVCYEDHTISILVEHQKLDESKKVEHATGELRWLAENLFEQPYYLRLDKKPVLLSFGQQGLNDQQWTDCLSSLPVSVAYFSQHRRRTSAQGGFDWPLPQQGTSVQSRFLKQAGDWPSSIPVAFPRFVDIYQQAGVRDSWGTIKDRDGETFRQTLRQAIASGAPLIQIATWNDWGEGTVIEPSAEFGYRDLIEVQQQRRKLDPEFAAVEDDLKLPAVWLGRRRWAEVDPDDTDDLAWQMARFELEEPRRVLGPAATVVEPPQEPQEYKELRDILYVDPATSDEYRQKQCRIQVHYPAQLKDYPTVVWFHPGGLTGGKPEIPAELKNQGLAVVAAGYRLHPQAKSPAYLEDAAAAVAWTVNNIHGYGGSPNKIFIAGHSAGGYLASMMVLDKRWLAAHELNADDLAGLISYSGHSITHMTIRKERGIDKEIPWVDQLAPQFHVRPGAPPILLLAGDREQEMLGRYEETAYFWRMLKVAGHKDVRLVELKGFDHGQMAKPGHPLALEFIHRVLRERAANDLP